MKLYTGQPNSGKSEALFIRMAEVVAHARGNPVLVAPSTASVVTLIKRLQPYLPSDSAENSRPVPISFPELSQKILKVAGMNPSLLTAIQRDRILRGVIADLAGRGRLIYFDKTAEKAGLAPTLASFINELWRSNTTPEQFARLHQTPGKKDADIALIFRQYEQVLRQSGAMDPEGAGVYALRWLEGIGQRVGGGGEQTVQRLKSIFPLIAVDGFDFYTPVQVKLLSQLSRLGIEVLVSLSYEADRAVHLWQKRTVERFIEAKAELIECQPAPANPIGEAAARFMNDNSGAAPSVSESAKIKIISAPDRGVELRVVAREIMRLVASGKVKEDEVTIVCRSLDLYAHHFERVFSECSMSFELDNLHRLDENPLVVALLRLFSLSENSFPRRAVIEILRSPYFDFSEFGLAEEQVDLLEHISLTEKVTHKREQWLDAIEQPTSGRPDELDPLAAPVAEESRSTLAAKLRRLFEALSFAQNGSRGHYIRQIEQLLITLRVSARTTGTGGSPAGEQAVTGVIGFAERAARAANEQRYQDETALKGFLDLLILLRSENAYSPVEAGNQGEAAEAESEFQARQAESRAGEKQINRGAFFAELQNSVAAATFPRQRRKSPSVVVQEVHNLRPRNYRAIFVLGLIEGEFPRKTSETTPYTLAEKAGLRDAGIDFAETINDAGADLTQFHKVMCRASERLFLSFARTDFSGGELLKSYLIDEVKGVAETVEWSIGQLGKADVPMSLDEFLSYDELALEAARRMRGETRGQPQPAKNRSLQEVSKLLKANLRSWSATMRGAAMEQRRLAGRERGIFGGLIENPKLRAEMRSRFGEAYLWSASKINDFGLCPFRFFAANVLNLSPVEEPAEGFVADRLGTAYHEILEKTFKQLKEEGIELKEESLDEAASIADRQCEAVLEKLLEEREIRKSGMWEFDKSEIKKRIVNLIRSEILSHSERAARPIAFEQRFGFGSQPPLVIGNDEGLIRIRGSIDRIDQTEDGLMVIDYKTSRSPISAREAVEGRNLQLPIYLMAAHRVLKRPEPVTGGYYFHIYSCRRGSELPNKYHSLEAITERAEVYIGDYVSRIRNAEFPVEPNQHRCPPYCKYDVMCRIQSLGSGADEE